MTKLLNDNDVRQKLESFHVRKYWLDYISAHNHYLNKINMDIIGIKKKNIKATAWLMVCLLFIQC